MINVKKVLMYIMIFILLFQESIQRMFHINFVDYIDELVVIIFTLIAFAKILKDKRINKRVIILLFLLLSFFISGTLSLYHNSSSLFLQYIESAFLSIKCFLLVIDIAIIGILCFIIGIFNFVAPNAYHKIFTFANLTYRFGFVSLTSLFYHTGRFGWFMLFLSLMNYSIFKNKGDNKNKKLFLLFGLCSLLSFRTKVIFSIVVILIINLILTKKIQLKKILISLSVVTIIFIIFNKPIMNTYYLYFDDDNTTVSARQSLMDNSYIIIKDYFPLGVGFGKYGSWYARKYYSEYYYKYNMSNIYGLDPNNAFFGTDTFWSAIFGETGFIGTVSYILLMLYIFLILKNNIKIDGKMSSICIYFGILVLIQSFVESFGEPSFNSPPQYIFLALVVGNALHETLKLKTLTVEQTSIDMFPLN